MGFLTEIPAEIQGQEGEPLEILIEASDEDNNTLTFWADNLPGGAVFDPNTQILTWTPGFEAAGTYENVTFIVSDRLLQTTQTTKILISPTNQAPQLVVPDERTVREGDRLRIQLSGNDPEGQSLNYSSNLLPGGANLDPNTGLFDWTPTYFQAGIFEIPFTISDGESVTTKTVKVNVLNVNAPPIFDDLGTWQVQEGQAIRFCAFAFDPDNPGFVPQDRLADGTLTPLEASDPSVTYTFANLPAGANFDPETAVFTWTPNFTSAGNYTVSFTATDNGDGTGTNQSATVNVPIRVLNTNRPPEITAITNKTLQRGEVLEIPIQVTDPDGNQITLTAKGLPGFEIPSFATFTDNGNGTGLLKLAPSFDDSGNYTINLTATDDGDRGGTGAILSKTYSFVVTVNAPNEPPHLPWIGDKVAVVGETLRFEFLVSDKNQDELNFSLSGLPASATLKQPPNKQH